MVINDLLKLNSFTDTSMNVVSKAEKNLKLEQDNLEMGQKFKKILSQYEEREKQMDRINKQMEVILRTIKFFILNTPYSNLKNIDFVP